MIDCGCATEGSTWFRSKVNIVRLEQRILHIHPWSSLKLGACGTIAACREAIATGLYCRLRNWYRNYISKVRNIVAPRLIFQYFR